MHNPNDIKSQDDLNEGKRSSEVLLATIEKLEQTQKKLDIAVKCLERYADHENWRESLIKVENNNAR